MSIHSPLEVRAKLHAYPVHLGQGLLTQVGPFVRDRGIAESGAICALITDANVAPLYGAVVQDSLHVAGFAPKLFVVPAGEASKSLSKLGDLAELLVNSGLDRGAFIVALGGGVVGDLAGFLASVYYRGIPFVQVPTTVVAQIDSAIGGKTGVNLPAGKNLLGAFYPPALVVVDVQTLASLPEREFNEGMAEAIKHAIIHDPGLFSHLESFDRNHIPALLEVVRRNLEIKAEIVSSDEFERDGARALLNFGHTVGHAIEQAAGYGRFLHGEAISLGMVAATRLSSLKAGLPPNEHARIIHALRHFGLPTVLEPGFLIDSVIKSMERDKKFVRGDIRFVLTPQIGQAFVSAPGQVTWEDLRREVESLLTDSRDRTSDPGF